MAKRFYISPIAGDGSFENPYRPVLHDTMEQEDGGVWEIASDANGRPIIPYALCLVNAVNHGKFGGLANVDGLPEITLDSTLSVLTNPQRNVLLNFLSKRGIDTSGLNVNSTFREVIERVGKALNSNFNSLNFDVSA